MKNTKTNPNPTKLITNTNKRTYKCNVKGCDNNTNYTKLCSLKKHTNAIHIGIRYTCDLCTEKTFSSKEALKAHRENHHFGKKKFFCEICNIAFALGSSQARHLQTTKHKGKEAARILSNMKNNLNNFGN